MHFHRKHGELIIISFRDIELSNRSRRCNYLTRENAPMTQCICNESMVSDQNVYLSFYCTRMVYYKMSNSRFSLHHYIVTSLHRYTVTSLHRYIVTTLHRYIVTSLHLYIFTSLHRYSATSLHRYTATSLHRDIVTTLHSYIVRSLHRYIVTS